MSKINDEIRELEMGIKELRDMIKFDKMLMNDIVGGRRTIYDAYPDFDNRLTHKTSVDWLKSRIAEEREEIAMCKQAISELYQQREWYECECNLPTATDIERIINNGNYIIGIRL